MKNKVITFSFLCFLLAIWNQNTKAQCPDVTCNTLAITNLNGKDISYAYEIKNIGTDTLFLSKVVFQNYVKPDSSTSTSNAYAAGGAFVYYGSKEYLLPGQKISGFYGANSYFATEPCPFLLLSLSYTGKTECNTTNNYTVKRLVQEPSVDAQFTSDIVAGISPVTVHFTDMSTNKPTAWKWDFNNDGIVDDSISQSPSYVYKTPGTYSVKLISSKVGSKDSITKTSYIVVDAPVDAQFKADVTTGTAPLTVHFTDQSTGSPTSWKWDFTNDGVVDSTSRNPSFIYKTPGTYAVKLIALKTGSSDTIVKTAYIIVNQQLPSGIESLENYECSVYPNPSNGPMYVKLGEKISKQSVVIEAYDNTGKMILSIKSVDKPEIKLDLSPFRAGIYTIKVVSDHKVLAKKVIRK